MMGPGGPLRGPAGGAPNAQLMSPVGSGFPGVNWSAAAARPARALPWWLLALVFVAVVGLALGLTFVVAKAV